MLIDTGADVTLLPIPCIKGLDLEPDVDDIYEVQGFSGESQFVGSTHLEMIFLGRKFTGKFLLIDQPMGILGRNILNSVPLLFDGPRSKWEEYKR